MNKRLLIGLSVLIVLFVAVIGDASAAVTIANAPLTVDRFSAIAPFDWTQLTSPTTPPARSRNAMAYDIKRGVTIMYGGYIPNVGDLGDTWEWDGRAWTQRFPVNSPGTRSGTAMAYDSRRHVTVLFGGNYLSVGDTWEWNGANWIRRFPTNSPTGRAHHALAYDSKRGVTVLFGGYNNMGDCPPGDYCNDTWEWDGNNWTQKFPTTVPPGRYWHSMTYDVKGGVTVMFGGRGALGASSNDTWEWDGNNWTQKFPANAPSIRSEQAMAYDSQQGVTILFGGERGVVYNDTWQWDGTNWIQQFPATQPLGRFTLAMTYDARRHAVVLFGGDAGGEVLLNDTWKYARH